MNILWIYLTVNIYHSVVAREESRKFPDGFKFGVATASYQIEGGWNASGKGENIWDRLVHTRPNLVVDNSTGDVASDSYHKWNEDIKLIKDLGVDYYRFSLSWSRLLPTGFGNIVNPDGVRYYNDLINGLLSNGIEPVVTLYHWDLPQPLQDLGGWPNPDIAMYFEDYALIAFALFGDRVKTWITVNEPPEICCSGYGVGINAPSIASPGIGEYLCGKTVLLAHAKAYRLYDTVFRKKQQGQVGITVDSVWREPKTENQEDIDAAERAMQMEYGWWIHPILSKEGDYPVVMKQRIANMSKSQNFSHSRLPHLSAQEVKLIRGTFDFLGLNHYSTWLISNDANPPVFPISRQADMAIIGSQDPAWGKSAAAWLRVVPWGFRKLLKWIKEEYGNPPVYVTENGFADLGQMDDTDRINYLKLYLNALLDAITLDGCNVKAYTVWSAIDNMEWCSGYSVRFGLSYVNFTDPDRPRKPKASFAFYKNVVESKSVPKEDYMESYKVF